MSTKMRLVLLACFFLALAAFLLRPVGRLGPETTEEAATARMRQLALCVEIMHEERVAVPVSDDSRLREFLSDPQVMFHRNIEHDLGMIRDRTIVDYWKHPIRTTFDGSLFTATSAGTDGAFGTADDIRVSRDVRKGK